MVGCTGVQRACDRGWVGTPLAPTRPLDGRIACKRHVALGDRLGPTEPPHQALEPWLGRSVLHDFLRHLDLFMTGSHETPPAQIRAQGTQPGTCRRQGGRLGHGELLSARGTSDDFPCERGDALAGVRSPASSSPLFCSPPVVALKTGSWIEYCFRTLKHLLATGACQMHSEDAYYGHLVLRLMGCLVLFYTSRVICKGQLTMEEIIFSLKHYWRFVDSESLELKALSQGGGEKAA